MISHEHAHNAAIGTFATLMAVTVPDTWLSYAGKLLFALLTTAITATASALIQRSLNPGKP